MAAIREIPVLLSAEDIAARVDSIAGEIAVSLPPDTIVVPLMCGSFMFAADLLRALHEAGMQPVVDFLGAGSYGAGTQSGGEVKLKRDLSIDVKGKSVLLVDDILETGHTLNFARKYALEKGASLVKTAILLHKPGKQDIALTPDFLGFKIPDRFVVGYGLDYAGRYRELPYIGWIEVH